MLGKALKQNYSRKEVCRVVAVSERQLRAWERQNLIPHLDSFAFPDLKVLQALKNLRESQVSPARIRRAVTALRERFQLGDYPLKDMRILADAGKMMVRFAGTRMEPITGQLLLDFDRKSPDHLLMLPSATERDGPEAVKREREAEFWFQKGLELEQTAAPVKEVVVAYERALELNPRLTVALVNLGTLYFHARAWGEAERYYKESLDVEPDYPLAHFNLGNLYDERGDRTKALHHYQLAIQHNPSYADAHYNLALLYQGSGQVMQAVHHWKTYLRLDSASSWASIARRQLEMLCRSVVRQTTKPDVQDHA